MMYSELSELIRYYYKRIKGGSYSHHLLEPDLTEVLVNYDIIEQIYYNIKESKQMIALAITVIGVKAFIKLHS